MHDCSVKRTLVTAAAEPAEPLLFLPEWDRGHSQAQPPRAARLPVLPLRQALQPPALQWAAWLPARPAG